VLVNGNSSVAYGVHLFAPDGKETIVGQGYFIDIATDADGNTYMLSESLNYDKRNITIMKREPGGFTSIVFRNSSSNFGPGYIIGSIAADPSGNLYIFDYYTTMNSSGDHLGTWSGGIQVEGSARLAKLCPNGTLITVHARDRLTFPETTRMAIGANGTIYTQDYTIYPDGTTEARVFPLCAPEIWTANDVIVGQDGYIYLAEGDRFNNSGGVVVKLNPDGPVVASWTGCGPDPFVNAYTVAADKNGRVYVADPLNQRIVWFDGNNYTYGNDISHNLAGKGVLWDNAVAGDNYSVWQQKLTEESENKPDYPSPGFGYLRIIAGLIVAGIVISFLKRRR
jgi:hypothetical protein